MKPLIPENSSSPAPPVTPDSSVSEMEIVAETAESIRREVEKVTILQRGFHTLPQIIESLILAAIRKAKAVQVTQGRWTVEKNEHEIGSWLVDERGKKIAYSQFDQNQKTIADAVNASLNRRSVRNTVKQTSEEKP